VMRHRHTNRVPRSNHQWRKFLLESRLASEPELIKARLEALGGGRPLSTDYDPNDSSDEGRQDSESEEGGP